MVLCRQKDMIKILICDDSAFSRVTLRKIVESDPSMRVVDVARNGKEALLKSEQLRPDIILLDVVMPEMDGLTALRAIVKQKIAPVIMISSDAESMASVTIEAIQSGAFDFIPKPEGKMSQVEYATALIQKIKRAVSSGIYAKMAEMELPAISPKMSSVADLPSGKGQTGGLGFKLVALGISTGGPRSIFKVLPFLPKDLNAAVVVVQHMPTSFIPAFTERLRSKTAMDCVESDAGMAVEPGRIYVARGGVHLRFLRKINQQVVIRQCKEPDHLFIPSVDVMMESALEIFGADTVGVLMTGMGRDGAEAMTHIARAGGVTIAESEETSVVFGMPQEAINRGGAKIIAPNWDIASHIIKAVRG